MKKLLALVLALVMTMGLATVGANAAFPEYGDAEDFVHDEAIAVVSAVGVLGGYPDGTFHPETVLTRAEASKIVAYLLTNNKTADSLIGTGKYSDVPASHWAAGYIEFLSTEGVLDGDGSGKFYPGDDLTVAAFAKMLLTALGYISEKEGLVGNDWIIYTTKLAADNKLFATLGDIAPRDPVTREQAAQMALNAMKAPLVEYTNKGGSITVNGATVELGGSGFTYVTSTIGAARHISSETLTNATTGDTRYIVEFAEQKYPELVLRPSEDPFGRPANEWTYGKETIGTFINRDLLIHEWHVAVTGADFCNVLTDAQIKNSTITYKVNGKLVEYQEPTDDDVVTYNQFGIDVSNLVRSNKIPYAFTGNGVLTEVYEKGEEIKIVSIYTYYATASANYNPTLDQLNLSFSAFNSATAGANLSGRYPAPYCVATQTWPGFVRNEDIPGVDKYKKGDQLLVKIARNDADNGWDVIEVKEPRVEKGISITKYSQKIVDAGSSTDNLNGLAYEGYIITGGVTQEFSKAVYPNSLNDYKTDNLDGVFDVVYDDFGYVIYTKASQGGTNYVFIAAVNNFTSNLGVTYADAYAIFEKGEDKVIKVNVLETNDNIAAYEKLRVDGTTTSKTFNGKVDKAYSIAFDTLNINLPLHAYNRWFSYDKTTVGGTEVYTLKPAANSVMVKNGSDYNYKSTQNGRTASTINPRSARVIGDYIDYNNAVDMTAANREQNTAWGNESSLYITVKTTRVNAGYNGYAYQTIDDGYNKGGVYQRAIAEVGTIYTGIQGVNLMAYDAFNYATHTDEEDAKVANPYREWIYALYDKDSKYIKSAIVLGSDVTENKNFIYAVSSANNQWIEDGYDYWEFNAIVEGEQKVLTVKEKLGDTIKNGIEAAVKFSGTGGGVGKGLTGLFQVNYDKDGYVIKAEQIAYTGNLKSTYGVYTNYDIGGQSNTVGDYATSLDGFKMWNTYFTAGDTHRANGYTLRNRFDYTAKGNPVYETENDIGLTILPNAPVYTVQEWVWPSSATRQTMVQQHDNFNDALAALADYNDTKASDESNAKRFAGYISAALDDSGRAKWVVLKNIGGYIDMNNNTGTSNTEKPSYERSVVLGDYHSDTGFTITLNNFAKDMSYNVEVYYVVGGDVAGSSNVKVTNSTQQTFTAGTTISHAIYLQGLQDGNVLAVRVYDGDGKVVYSDNRVRVNTD